MNKIVVLIAISALAVLTAMSCANPASTDLGSSQDRSITRTFTTAVDVFNFAADGYNSSVGPISIVKGTLTVSGSSKTVYLVGLSGTQMKTNQATGIINDLQSGFGVEGAYVTAVKNAIANKAPAGSNLILVGHSLGGMVAQQIAADSTIKNNYVVLNTITFGSPLVDGLYREGSVQRLGDTVDVVPYLSYSSLFVSTSIWNIFGLNRENGGYGSNILSAHKESYKRSDVWGKYSALGYKYQTAAIAIDDSTRTWYAAPAGWTYFTY